MSKESGNPSRYTDIRTNAAVLLFGLVFLACNSRYPVGAWGNPGTGVFPFLAGSLLVILAAWRLAVEVRFVLRKGPAEPGSDERALSAAAKRRRMTGRGCLASVTVILVVYLSVITCIGLLSRFFSS